jgi:hypothetical protein
MLSAQQSMPRSSSGEKSSLAAAIASGAKLASPRRLERRDDLVIRPPGVPADVVDSGLSRRRYRITPGRCS